MSREIEEAAFELYRVALCQFQFPWGGYAFPAERLARVAFDQAARQFADVDGNANEDN